MERIKKLFWALLGSGLLFAASVAVTLAAPTAPQNPVVIVAGTTGTKVAIPGINFGSSLPAVSFAGGAALPACPKGTTTGCVSAHNAKSITVLAPAQGGGGTLQAITVTV